MRVNLKVALKNITGETVVDEAGKPVVLSTLCINALLAENKEEKADGVKMLERYRLAKRINAEEAAELTLEEAVLIKELVAKTYSALVYGNLCDVLDETR